MGIVQEANPIEWKQGAANSSDEADKKRDEADK